MAARRETATYGLAPLRKTGEPIRGGEEGGLKRLANQSATTGRSKSLSELESEKGRSDRGSTNQNKEAGREVGAAAVPQSRGLVPPPPP